MNYGNTVSLQKLYTTAGNEVDFRYTKRRAAVHTILTENSLHSGIIRIVLCYPPQFDVSMLVFFLLKH